MFFQPPYDDTSAAPRRGIVLLVVISLLTIFAVAGIAFVYYADSEATASRHFREGTNFPQPNVDPELLFASFMQQFLFDAPDDETGVYSAMRGLSLYRNIYGYNDALANLVPFNGDGRLSESITFTATSGGAPASVTLDGQDLINYQFARYNDGNPGTSGTVIFQIPAGMPAVIGGVAKPLPKAITFQAVLRDPERVAQRTVPAVPGTSNPNFSDLTQRGVFIGGLNPGYTYPDRNNMFLAAVKADGTVMTPSFHRAWQRVAGNANTGFGSLDPTNPNWLDASVPFMKYMVLRPRPIDQLLPKEMALLAKFPGAVVPGNPASWQNVAKIIGRNPFPMTADAGGDVQNAKGWTKGNDSFWTYCGSPVMKLPDGRQFTMMYAALIVDLDGRVNVNVHGNIYGQDLVPGAKSSIPLLAHRSHQGWGPWEVNLGQVMNLNGNEWTNLFVGVDLAGTPQPPANPNKRLIGRYGTDQVVLPALAAGANPAALGFPTPTSGTIWPSPRLAPLYSQYDFNAAKNALGTQASTPFQVPWGVSIAAATEKAGLVTITTGVPHGLSVQQYVTITGVGVAGYNGIFQIVAVPSATTFKYANPLAGLAASGGGQAMTNPFPIYPDSAADGSYGNGAPLELVYHPSTYNVFSPVYVSNSPTAPGGYDRRFATSELEALYRRGDTGTESLTSDLLRLCPANFSNGRIRQMITTDSNDLDVPGLTPWLYNDLAVQGGQIWNSNTYAQQWSATDVFAPPYAGKNPTSVSNAIIRPAPIGASEVGNTVIIQTAASHGLSVGQIVTIAGVPQAGYNGSYQITSVPTLTSFTYTAPLPGLKPSGGGTVATQPGPGIFFPSLLWRPAGAVAGFSPTTAGTPGFPYPSAKEFSDIDLWRWQSINKLAKAIIAPAPGGAVEAGKNAVITTLGAHGLTPGQIVTINGVAVPGYNGTFQVVTVPGATTFTYTLPTPGLGVSGGGAVLVDGNTERVNLNRPLTPYPSPSYLVRFDDPTQPNVTAQYQAAQSDRQNLANDIYNRLLLATGLPRTLSVIAPAPVGGVPPLAGGATAKGTTVTIKTTAPHGLVPGTSVTISSVPVAGYNGPFTITSVPNPTSFTYTVKKGGLAPSGGGYFDPPYSNDLRVRRWLAQLAANIVDYIDDDDISTPFNFYSPNDALASNDTAYNIAAANGTQPMYWVFGTELPRVVLSEALVESKQTTAPKPPAKVQEVTSSGTGAGNYPGQTINVFAELFNTMTPPGTFPGLTYPATVRGQDGQAVPLFVSKLKGISLATGLPSAGYAPFQVTAGYQILPKDYNVLGDLTSTGALPLTPTDLTTQDNDFDPTPKTGNPKIGTVAGPNTPAAPPAGYPSLAPQSYLLIGPDTSAIPTATPPIPATSTVYTTITPQTKKNPNGVPGATSWLQGFVTKTIVGKKIVSTSQSLQKPGVTTLPLANPPLTTAKPAQTASERTNGMTVALRRLANPHLPLVTNPASAWYNPYITIDSIPNVPIWGASTTPTSRAKKQPYSGVYKAPPSGGGAPPPPAPGAYAAATDSPVADETTATSNATVFHSFGKPNAPKPKSGHYDWLVHLDRQLISPMELLHVSGFQPHQLTQRFVTGDNDNAQNMFQHYVPWTMNPNDRNNLQQDFRLYRAFEFLETGSYAAGVATVVQPTNTKIVIPKAAGKAVRTVTLMDPVAKTALPIYGFSAGGVYWQIEPRTQLVPGTHLLIDAGTANEEIVEVLLTPSANSFTASFTKPHGPAFYSITVPLRSARIPGKININTVWDWEIFLALCDAQPNLPWTTASPNGPNFTPANVQKMLAFMLNKRTPGFVPGANDRPYRPFTTGTTPPFGTQYPNGLGVYDTLLGAVALNSSTPLSQLATSGPIVLASEVKNTVTITTADPHYLQVGQAVTISGFVAAPTPPPPPPPPPPATNYNGTFIITSVPSPTTFTYTDPTKGIQPATGGYFTLAPLPPASPLPASPPNHPYYQNELLTKIYNNLTVRSNTFAVWVTVGFFEVPPGGELFNPPILGAELNLAQNRNVRHRMFSIIDRTNPWYVTTAAAIAGPGAPKPPPAYPPAGSSLIQPAFMSDMLQVGDWLTIGSGASQETVQVTGVDFAASPPTFSAVLSLAHPAIGPNTPCVIMGKGNPGPRTGALGIDLNTNRPPAGIFNPHAHPDIIRHFSIIE